MAHKPFTDASDCLSGGFYYTQRIPTVRPHCVMMGLPKFFFIHKHNYKYKYKYKYKHKYSCKCKCKRKCTFITLMFNKINTLMSLLLGFGLNKPKQPPIADISVHPIQFCLVIIITIHRPKIRQVLL
ncbi:hypothetical protein PHYBLDRAFT_61429 [Phycomyces blakesleeanus NRRL 1555(-)]|uniref:Uncharacterized protein n=2 Tax=Phycomyces blakesleeanus TaxID=4837 RepID=A0A167QWB3_PHYB8|nr:hypothetical protein PHYBLDRAFT_61429 [Phycomyces blakesleeanus NRRL 1555(-)]OAD80379.1 hypothetical protein PHYBLDRAFT_61429 [Phycomyces blakesleeanus NRRL 1555(-)]|eukprot:XP_018298419.1 hypothetical protein PHYBLDRAFT_61429 [Phycomyces blakesleeanus NRRL 1555(-)]